MVEQIDDPTCAEPSTCEEPTTAEQFRSEELRLCETAKARPKRARCDVDADDLKEFHERSDLLEQPEASLRKSRSSHADHLYAAEAQVEVVRKQMVAITQSMNDLKTAGCSDDADVARVAGLVLHAIQIVDEFGSAKTPDLACIFLVLHHSCQQQNSVVKQRGIVEKFDEILNARAAGRKKAANDERKRDIRRQREEEAQSSAARIAELDAELALLDNKPGEEHLEQQMKTG